MNFNNRTMFTVAQEQKTRRLKKELIDRGMTVTELARRIERPRSSVSKAINRGLFPTVRSAIEQELS